MLNLLGGTARVVLAASDHEARLVSNVERFRNPNGVAPKLADFASLDPRDPGVGVSRGGGGPLDME